MLPSTLLASRVTTQFFSIFAAPSTKLPTWHGSFRSSADGMSLSVSFGGPGASVTAGRSSSDGNMATSEAIARGPAEVIRHKDCSA